MQSPLQVSNTRQATRNLPCLGNNSHTDCMPERLYFHLLGYIKYFIASPSYFHSVTWLLDGTPQTTCVAHILSCWAVLRCGVWEPLRERMESPSGA